MSLLVRTGICIANALRSAVFTNRKTPSYGGGMEKLMEIKKRVLAAMSGGVDSTVAAWLSLRDGFETEGAVMLLCGGGTRQEAHEAALRLGVPFHVFDFTTVFEEQVIAPFIDAYRNGKTPNPCVLCNRRLKFGEFIDKSREMGMEAVVTGHYARVEYDSAAGRYLLKKGADAGKDQSYVLYCLNQEQLAHARFPLGGLTKTQVREISAREKLVNAEKPESQDICFVPDGDYAGFIKSHTGVSPRKGRFVDESGAYLGENKGIISYTVGQRRGLGLAMPHPIYVLRIQPEDDTVVVGRKERLFSKSLIMRDINLITSDRLPASLRASVKIRYKQTEQPATVFQTASDELRVEFDAPQRAVTKGQAAVIYDGDIVIGGGTIV